MGDALGNLGVISLDSSLGEQVPSDWPMSSMVVDRSLPYPVPVGNPIEMSLLGQSIPEQDPPPDPQMESFNNFSQATKAQGQEEMTAGAMQGLDVRRKPDGTMDIKNVQPELMDMIQQSVNFRQQALAGYASELARIQEMERRRSPLVNVLTQVAGQLAQDPRVNPVVGALGRASMALNPTEQQLRAQKLGIMEKQSDLATEGLTMHYRMEEMAGRAADRKAAATAKSDKERYDNVEEAARQLHQNARADASFNEDAARGYLEAAGATPNEVARILGSVKATAAGEQKRRNEDIADRIRRDADRDASREQQKFIADQAHSDRLLMAAMAAGTGDARALASTWTKQAEGVRKEMEMPAPVREEVDSLQKAYSKLDAAEKAIGRLQKVTGRFRGKLTELDWSKSPGEKEAMSKVYASLIDSLNAEGEKLGRATEMDAKFYKARALSLTDPVETTLGQIRELKTNIMRGFDRKLALNPLVDWGGRYYDVFPPELRQKVRSKYPPGAIPAEIYAKGVYDPQVFEIVKGAQNAVTAARGTLGTPRLEPPAATPKPKSGTKITTKSGIEVEISD